MTSYQEVALVIKKLHDTVFKYAFSNLQNTKDFLKNHLPEKISSKIDYDSIRIIDSEKSDQEYDKYFLDMAIQCRISGTESDIYFVFEHKSTYDKLTLIQILRYCTVVWENNINNNEPLRPIIPVLFYHGRQELDLPERFGGYFDIEDADIRGYLLDFGYVLFDTSKYSDDEIMKKSYNNAWFMATLLAMKHIFSKSEDLTIVIELIKKLDQNMACI